MSNPEINNKCNDSDKIRIAGDVAPEFYDRGYYDRYHKGKFVSRGDKPFIYNYWVNYFKKKYPQQSKLLDIGCGEGYFCKRASEYFETFGIDISPDAISLAKEHSPNTQFLVSSGMEGVPIKEESMDIIVCCDVVEHLSDPSMMLREMNRLLKPHGILLLSTPNPGSIGKRNKKNNWFGYRDKSHVSLLLVNDWLTIFNSTGFVAKRYGSDFLWDIPYAIPLPKVIQKIILIPVNITVSRLFGFLPWVWGENLWFIIRKNSN